METIRLIITNSILFILMLFFNSNLFSQGLSGGAAGARATNPEFPQLLEWTIKEQDVASDMKGSPYIEDDWKTSNILFKNDQILEGLSAKYDLVNNLMEIQTAKDIKVCPSDRIIAFELIDKENEQMRQFVNCNRFNSEEQLEGFYEVLVESEHGLNLFKRIEVIIKKPSYNPALDVGDLNSTIMKKESLFIAKGEKVYKAPRNKKKFLDLFEGKNAEVNLYLKEEKLNINDEADLVKIITNYNSIL